MVLESAKFLNANKIKESISLKFEIIASHFANCKMNSSYFNCKVVNHTKMAKQFFEKENLVCPNYIFLHYIFIVFIHCILLSTKILLNLKTMLKNAKDPLQFLKKIFACNRAGFPIVGGMGGQPPMP